MKQALFNVPTMYYCLNFRIFQEKRRRGQTFVLFLLSDDLWGAAVIPVRISDNVLIPQLKYCIKIGPFQTTPIKAVHFRPSHYQSLNEGKRRSFVKTAA